jgi:hypothetical protein
MLYSTCGRYASYINLQSRPAVLSTRKDVEEQRNNALKYTDPKPDSNSIVVYLELSAHCVPNYRVLDGSLDRTEPELLLKLTGPLLRWQLICFCSLYS